MKNLSWIMLVGMFFSAITYAFSPYENYLLSGKPTYVGLIARAKSGQEERLSQQLATLCREMRN